MADDDHFNAIMGPPREARASDFSGRVCIKHDGQPAEWCRNLPHGPDAYDPFDPAHLDAMRATPSYSEWLVSKEAFDFPKANPGLARAAKTDDGTLTTFASGATRDTSAGKLDYEAFYSPLVVERFARYMDKNRVQSDGNLRAGDNWQKGFTRSSYMKSMWRHFMDVWKHHRGLAVDADFEDALCAVIFNAQGYLFELLQGRDA